MFYRLTTVADDYGRFQAESEMLLASCYPLRVKRLNLSIIDKRREELVRAGLIGLYDHGGRTYGHFFTFQKHQGPARARTSKHPEPPPASICPQMSADVPVIEVRNRVLPESKSESVRPLNAGPSCAECQAALEELNRQTSRHYTGSGEGLRMLHARHQEHGMPAVLRVIRVKVGAWLDSPKWSKYLRPETLFRPTKFDGYLNEPEPVVPGILEPVKR